MAVLTSLIILLNIDLDILPMLVLLVLISLDLIVAGKLSLWSLIVIYDLETFNLGIRLPDILFILSIFCAQEFIRSTELLSHFL